jgi:anti-anti-sigma regulatory factor
MLRITEKKEGKNTRVEAEIIRGLDDGKKIVLDFSKVGFIDEDAAEMIKRFPQKKVERRNGSLFIRTILGMKDRGTE